MLMRKAPLLVIILAFLIHQGCYMMMPMTHGAHDMKHTPDKGKETEEIACPCHTKHPGCKCDHCQKTAAKCDCELETKGHEKDEHQHKEG
ncbi:MAG: hypothetical protein A2060_03735 [Planctomycetes bacterium GWA2_50_13]|nr:MAG: hypothetical protein A2060_03735 [Planctomycetes bacterium GWA2_50_13]OHB95467.1 MAG: hypothetical protein A3I59_07520 [Planctomycetes bacterium RIFCSPLOWO2_02_FULL_50_16]OHC02216.1 MAG: hypothetical protein A3G17_08055 [Planctomycetes bacterium RIFCSPLOWO2_12_FULL_50_35]